MTQQEAVQIAAAARPSYQVSDAFRFRKAERCIIEIVWGHRPVGDQLPPPGLVADRVAWLVTFMMDPWTVEFAVDDQTGEILRFRRSRSAALAGIGGTDVCA